MDVLFICGDRASITLAALWLAGSTVVGCTGEPGLVEAPAPACEGVSRSALGAADRKIVGGAAPYVADGTLRARDAELSSSQALRREVAWQTVAKVLETVPLAETLPSGLPGRIPAWQTWYDLDDLRRVFYHLYEDLPTDDKIARARFVDGDLDAAFGWNTTAVDELPSWPLDRYLEYLDAIDEEGEVAGLGGISRVSYSPSAARHLLSSYPEVLACREGGVPPTHATGPLVTTPVARAQVAAAPCQQQDVGSYAIEEDETLVVVLEEGDDATLTLRAGDQHCEAAPGTRCELSGPATVDVSVAAGAEPLHSVVEVTRESTRPAWSACLESAFPQDAVVVKADYRRADFDMTMPAYDTSAPAMEQRLSGDVTWDGADGEASPPPGDVYTLKLPNGATYRLAALHIMTKELDHWLWITLWWSPAPAVDFGADRPASIEGPWANYKMCVASAFEEGDPLPLLESHPTLADALSAVHQGAASWCSNPYLERGHGNAGTNCIGCHQHGGTSLSSEEILLFTDRGRPSARNNFPADYSWATTSGDNLAQLFADAELYHLGPP